MSCNILNRSPSESASLLLPYLLNRVLPSGFLNDLLDFASKSSEELSDVFGPVVRHLLAVLRSCSLISDDYMGPLTLLSELLEFRVGTARPICSLV